MGRRAWSVGQWALGTAVVSMVACVGPVPEVPSPSGEPAARLTPMDVLLVDADLDGVPAVRDCDDDNWTVRPGAYELCDGLDTDCNGELGLVDLDRDGNGWPDCRDCDDNLDADGDGVGSCADCDDADATIHPGATELCDGVDNDCDGDVPSNERDRDGDGSRACDDCDDGFALVYPGAPAVCGGVDSDCDGQVDTPPGPAPDADGDGADVCTDCDDADETVHPGATELCDGLDNDCDWSTQHALEYDRDDDGSPECLDCAPEDQAIRPGAVEVCDGRDNDCDGVLHPDWTVDGDGDGVPLCEDCDDADPSLGTSVFGGLGLGAACEPLDWAVAALAAMEEIHSLDEALSERLGEECPVTSTVATEVSIPTDKNCGVDETTVAEVWDAGCATEGYLLAGEAAIEAVDGEITGFACIWGDHEERWFEADSLRWRDRAGGGTLALHGTFEDVFRYGEVYRGSQWEYRADAVVERVGPLPTPALEAALPPGVTVINWTAARSLTEATWIGWSAETGRIDGSAVALAYTSPWKMTVAMDAPSADRNWPTYDYPGGPLCELEGTGRMTLALHDTVDGEPTTTFELLFDGEVCDGCAEVWQDGVGLGLACSDAFGLSE